MQFRGQRREERGDPATSQDLQDTRTPFLGLDPPPLILYSRISYLDDHSRISDVCGGGASYHAQRVFFIGSLRDYFVRSGPTLSEATSRTIGSM